jgi:metal-dependent amidase/aminoacylase/carboxypeptidase family protein
MLDDISVYDTLETSPKVSHCFGLHLSSDKILHTVGYHSGPFSSLSDRFEINIEGKGGHAMVPD